MSRVSRRELLRLAGATGTGLLGVALGACAPSAPATPATAVPLGAQPAAKAAPAQTTAAAAAWDQLVAAAQKEGKIVVSGPPVPEARTKMPEAFKQRFNIEMDYLAVNSSQLASRIETERAAGQYTMDVSMGGPDTVYATFLPNKWLDPLKPALILPEVLDPKVWPTGGPWFRDPGGETSLQLFNTITPVYMNQYQGTVPVQELVLPDLPTATAGGYGIISLWNQAPHPNAAKVYVNWIASKDGLSVYGALDQSAPVRTDVDASAWVPPHLIPKPGTEYFDTFEYKYVMEKRQPIARFYASLKG